MELIIDILRESCQQSSLYRFHNNQRNLLLYGEFIAFQSGLLIYIFVVELELAEVPIFIIEDFLQHFVIIMERKSEVPDASFRFQLFTVVHYTQFYHGTPFVFIQRMQQIIIDIIGLQTFALFLKKSLCILHGIYQPYRQFRCKIQAAAMVFLQCLSQKGLTFSVVIRICRVNIVDSGCNCLVQHFLRFRLIDFSVCGLRESHASKSK